MAITTLVPTIRVCVTDNCSKLKVYDTTGVESTSNTGGWGTTNIEATAVDSVIFSYTMPGTTTAIEVDVTTTVNAQTIVSGEFLIAEIDITATDGTYSFVYSLTEGTSTVVKRCSIYSLCVVRCCVDKLWAKAAQELVGTNCTSCTGETTSYSYRAMYAEAAYNSILKSASCVNTATRDSLLEKLQRICKLENCNCN